MKNIEWRHVNWNTTGEKGMARNIPNNEKQRPETKTTLMESEREGKMAEEWMEVTLTSSQDQSGITTQLWRNHPEQTTKQ